MAEVKAITGEILYVTEIHARNHQILVDEPKEIGGQDSGMSPLELMAASLASCTSITLRMYINRKEWQVNNIHVSVKTVNNKEDKSTTFMRSIQWEGSLEEEQQKRLLHIANACPIHKILEQGNIIETRLVNS